MKKSRRYIMTVIVFFVVVINNKTHPMENDNEILTFVKVNDNNREQTKTFLTTHYSKNPNDLSCRGNLIDSFCWLFYSQKYKQSRMVGALSSNKNNLNILDNNTQEMIGFINIVQRDESSIIDYWGGERSIINNILCADSDRTDIIRCLAKNFFENSNINTIEHSKCPKNSKFLTNNGFTLITSSYWNQGYYELTKKKYLKLICTPEV